MCFFSDRHHFSVNLDSRDSIRPELRDLQFMRKVSGNQDQERVVMAVGKMATTDLDLPKIMLVQVRGSF